MDWIFLVLLIVIVILLVDLNSGISRLTKIVDMAFTSDQELKGKSVAYDNNSIRNTLHKIESKLDRLAQKKGIF